MKNIDVKSLLNQAGCRHMKYILLMIGMVALVGCGRKEPVQLSVSNTEEIKLWEFKTGGAIGDSSSAIGSDGTVYVGSFDKKLYAINGMTGAKLWEFKTGWSVQSSPAIGPDGTVYVRSDDKKLYAFRTDSKGLAKSPWPMRGQNARHTGRTK